jgi:hypothetical protein
VLIWSGEDDPRDTLVPRLLACGADLSRIHFVGSVTEDEGIRPFDPARDAALLRAEATTMDPPPALLNVDPIVSAVTGDSHKNAEVRRGLQPLVELAMVVRCVVLGVSHFTKGTMGRDPVERVTGSLAFAALARVVLATAKLSAGESGGRVLARAKNNLGPDAGGFSYELEPLELAAHPASTPPGYAGAPPWRARRGNFSGRPRRSRTQTNAPPSRMPRPGSATPWVSVRWTAQSSSGWPGLRAFRNAPSTARPARWASSGPRAGLARCVCGPCAPRRPCLPRKRGWQSLAHLPWRYPSLPVIANHQSLAPMSRLARMRRTGSPSRRTSKWNRETCLPGWTGRPFC